MSWHNDEGLGCKKCGIIEGFTGCFCDDCRPKKSLRIEIGESYKKGLYSLRIGDLTGATESNLLTKKEILEEIEEEINELE